MGAVAGRVSTTTGSYVGTPELTTQRNGNRVVRQITLVPRAGAIRRGTGSTVTLG